MCKISNLAHTPEDKDQQKLTNQNQINGPGIIEMDCESLSKDKSYII